MRLLSLVTVRWRMSPTPALDLSENSWVEQVIVEGKVVWPQVYPRRGNMFIALDTLFRLRRSKGRNERRVPPPS